MIEQYPVSVTATLLSYPESCQEEWVVKVFRSFQFPGVIFPAKNIEEPNCYWFVGYLDYRFDNFVHLSSYLSGGEKLPVVHQSVRREGLNIYPQLGARKIVPASEPVSSFMEEAIGVTICQSSETVETILANLVNLFMVSHIKDKALI